MLVAAATPATATPVGAFSYDVDGFFGPVFTIENFFDSPGTFTGVMIHLLLGPDKTDVVDLSVGDIGSGNLAQAFLDDPFAVSFDSASVDVSFTKAGSLQVDELTSLTFDVNSFTGNAATTAINFTPDQTQNVPEPSTLLLVASGAAFVFRRRR